MNWTLWQIAIGVTAVYGVGVKPLARSHKAPHSKKLRGNPYVKYPIANTYELDPMAVRHSYQSNCSVWSEPYGTQVQSSPQQNDMGFSLCNIPHCKTPSNWTLWQKPILAIRADCVWSELYTTQLRSTPQQIVIPVFSTP